MKGRMYVALFGALWLAGAAHAADQELPPPDQSTDSTDSMLSTTTTATAAAAGGSGAVQPWEEYDKLIKARGAVTALGPALFGDEVNLYTGALSFSNTEFSLPGNSRLPVAITRRFSAATRKAVSAGQEMFADWELDLPNISGVFAGEWVGSSSSQPLKRCSDTIGIPPDLQSGTTIFKAADYWHGLQANLPGGGEMLLAKPGVTRPATGTYYWLTSGFTYFSCLPANQNEAGEGFQALATDGTRYTFDFMAGYDEPALKGAKSTDPYIARMRRVLYATRVEDRFGNWVAYRFDTTTPDQPARLLSITASDGRQVALQYDGYGHVANINDGSHTWTYQYSADQTSLTAVIQPDGTRWSIDFQALDSSALRYLKGAPGEPYRDCLNPGDPADTTPKVGTITHPSGAVGQFTMAVTRFGRTNVPRMCGGETLPTNDPNDDVSFYPVLWDSYALSTKHVTGPGVVAADWTYTFTSYGSFAAGTPSCSNGICPPTCTADTCAGRDTVEVNGPGGGWTRYQFGNSYRYNEGKLLQVDVGTGPSDIRKTVATTYDFSQSGLQFPAQIGRSPQYRSDAFDAETPRPQLTRTVSQDGSTFRSTVNSFDALVRPLSVTRSSSLGYSRTEVTAYFDQTTAWVLGQPKTVTCTAPASCTPAWAPGGIVMAQTDYDATTAAPTRSYDFGKLHQVLAYNTDGTLRSAQDGAGHTTTLSGWRRGIPQTITYAATLDQPTPAGESAVVNDDGTIASTTDETGAKTCYAYDPMGRISQITYPSEATNGVCDASTWAPSTQSFQPVAAAEYGIPAGHWKQTVSTGNGRQVVYFDAFWRPLVEERYDAGNATATRSLAVKRYDASGRPVFQGLPSATLTDYNAVTAGTTSTYDPLDRVTSTSLPSSDSATGTFTTRTEYLPGSQVRVTNARGFATTTSYAVWDEPTSDYPVGIAAPEGSNTDIARDAFGKPLALVRRNADGSVRETRSYVYNAAQELCKTIEPESGSTLQHFDLAGNLDWNAAGLPLPGTTSCDDNDATVAARKVTRSYDARNRVLGMAFPDHRGDTSYRYAADGQVTSMTADNGDANQVTTSYTYNHRRLLTQETLAWPSVLSWPVSYAYDANGHLASQSWHGISATYAPNALGQPTQVGSYASGVSYYPNGALRQFTYGNGLVHTLTQNDRQMPDRSRDAYAGVAVLDDSYDYDGNGNVAAISDALPGNRGNRTMGYDGLDRLTGVASPMYGTSGAHYTYDALDNLTHVGLGGSGTRDQYYCYDAAWRLTNLKTGSCTGSTLTGLGYDAQGNLANRNGQLFDFDYGNRLRTVTTGAVVNGTYVYDGLGRRVRELTTANKYSQYTRAGQLAMTSDEQSNKVDEYFYLAGSLVAIRERDVATGAYTVKYQHTDALGSPVAVTDPGRNIIERTEYEPYGKVLNRPLRDAPGYTGHVEDASTGLDYMQQRYYDSAIGRFLSVDPVTAYSNPVRAFNRYWYADSNPYKFTDPDGRCTGSHIANDDGTCVSTGTYTTSGFNPPTMGTGDYHFAISSTSSITTKPVEGTINRRDPSTRTADGGYDPYGSRRLRSNGARPHKGIDIGASPGTPVRAAGDGTATNRSDPEGYGRYIIIDHGGGLTTRYAHLSASDVSNGETVRAGDRIGLTGTSGNLPPGATPHLHFEVRQDGVPQDPTSYLDYDYAP